MKPPLGMALGSLSLFLKALKITGDLIPHLYKWMRDVGMKIDRC